MDSSFGFSLRILPWAHGPGPWENPKEGSKGRIHVYIYMCVYIYMYISATALQRESVNSGCSDPPQPHFQWTQGPGLLLLPFPGLGVQAWGLDAWILGCF